MGCTFQCAEINDRPVISKMDNILSIADTMGEQIEELFGSMTPENDDEVFDFDDFGKTDAK